MKKRPARAFIVIILLLAGCIKAPTAVQLAEADYGPFPQGYATAIKNALSARGVFTERSMLSFGEGPQQTYKHKGEEIIFGWGGTVGLYDRIPKDAVNSGLDSYRELPDGQDLFLLDRYFYFFRDGRLLLLHRESEVPAFPEGPF